MALAAIPDEISQHIEAALALSKRDVLLRILDEAEVCLRSEALAAAAILAAVILEEVSVLNLGVLEEEQNNIKIWREMRNHAVHASGGRAELTAGQVERMVTGIRSMLSRTGTPRRHCYQSKIRSKGLVGSMHSLKRQ